MESAREKTINLYAGNWWEKFLSNFKFWEEPYEVVEKILPKNGTVLDLGCGEGLLSNYLAIASDKRKITGIEIAPERLERAKKGMIDFASLVSPYSESKSNSHHHVSSRGTQ